jgi:hypothetical protein
VSLQAKILPAASVSRRSIPTDIFKTHRIPATIPLVENKFAARGSNRCIADAQKIVAIWNARQAGGRALRFYPTIGAAIAAGLPWLSFSCPACGQFGSVNLRTLDRHPGGAISALIPSLSCRRCSPNAPCARLQMLTADRL